MNWGRKLPVAGFWTTLCCAPFSTQTLLAVDCSTPTPGLSVSQASTFNITTAGFTDAEVQTAIGYWSSCGGYGAEIPTFQIRGSGGIPVTVVKISGNAPPDVEGCGFFDPDAPTGQIESATITVWTSNSKGGACPLLTDVLAHEFGHLLGLANAPDLSCAGFIMGRSFGGTSTRTVGAGECAVADDMWETPAESDPPNDPWCDAYCWTSCVNNSCPQGHPGCPILFDLEGNGIRLTALNDPVWFDIDADGDRDLMSWTNRSEGILAFDRNGNGMIDDGGELFGNATLLADGTRALNGYLALAELDSWAFGGNGDEFIDSADAAFTSLWIWTDLSHDGASQPQELQTLDERGVRRIGLDYRRSNRTDRYGNEFRFLGRAWKEDRHGVLRPMLTWDVFFMVAPEH